MQIQFRCSVVSGFIGLVSLILTTAPSSADIMGSELRERLNAGISWDELCAIEDCSQFPAGHHTYVFGSEVYYFPNYNTMTEKPPSATYGGVRSAGTMELSDDDKILRSFGFATGLIISN